jgi:hypothetical protein
LRVEKKFQNVIANGGELTRYGAIAVSLRSQNVFLNFSLSQFWVAQKVRRKKEKEEVAEVGLQIRAYSRTAETPNAANPLTETIRLRVPKITFQAEAGEDGMHFIGLRTSRVLL